MYRIRRTKRRNYYNGIYGKPKLTEATEKITKTFDEEFQEYMIEFRSMIEKELL